MRNHSRSLLVAIAASAITLPMMLGSVEAIAQQDGSTGQDRERSVTAGQQARERGVPVHERFRPELEPIGARAGSWRIKPGVGVSVVRDDNIFAVDTDRTSDTITRIRPEVELKSDWSRHELAANASLDRGIYSSNSDENYTDHGLSLSARADVRRETHLTGVLARDRLHEERGDPNVLETNAEPLTFDRTRTEGRVYHGAGRFSVRAGLGVTDLDYRSVRQLDGSVRSLDERDRDIRAWDVRLAYELIPNVIPFVWIREDRRRYDLSDVGRDSDGRRIGVGTGFDLGGITTGQVYAGRLKQEYKSDEFDDISGTWFGGSVLWSLSQITSLELDADRTVEETIIGGVSGFERTRWGVRIDHELRRNLLLGARFDRIRDDFNRVAEADFRDKRRVVGAHINYLWNRNLSARFSLSNSRRESNAVLIDGGSRDFRINRVAFELIARY